jgi:hypothetical protein
MTPTERLIEEHRQRAASLRQQLGGLRARPLSPIRKRLRQQVALHERTVRTLERLNAKATRR